MAQTVLVADDNLTIQRMALEILSPQGLQVVTVANGVAALKKLPLVQPQLVLADVDMPGKDGYEVCGYIKNSPELKHIWVLLAASDSDPYDGERGANAGADGFIRKPFNRDDLIAAVTGLLDRPEAVADLREPAMDLGFDVSAPMAAVESSGNKQDDPETFVGEGPTTFSAESAPLAGDEPNAQPASETESFQAEHREAQRDTTLEAVLEATEAATRSSMEQTPAVVVADEPDRRQAADLPLATVAAEEEAAAPQSECEAHEELPAWSTRPEAALLPESLPGSELAFPPEVAKTRDETLAKDVTLPEEAGTPQDSTALAAGLAPRECMITEDPLWACPDEEALSMQCYGLPEPKSEQTRAPEYHKHQSALPADCDATQAGEAQDIMDAMLDLPAQPDPEWQVACDALDLMDPPLSVAALEPAETLEVPAQAELITAPGNFPVAAEAPAMTEAALAAKEAPNESVWSHKPEAELAPVEAEEARVKTETVLASSNGEGENHGGWSDSAANPNPGLAALLAEPGVPEAENELTADPPAGGATWSGGELPQTGGSAMPDDQPAGTIDAPSSQIISSAPEPAFTKPAAPWNESHPQAEPGEMASDHHGKCDEARPIPGPEEFATTSVAPLSAASPVMVVPSLTPADFSAPQRGPAMPETEWISRIVKKTVSKMAPTALPAEVVAKLAQRITDEVIADLAFDPRPAP